MTIDNSLGFKKNPFSKKSSEQELQFLNEIFFQPNYYTTLQDNLSNGDSRFIIGQRGHGKSSIINKLFKDLEKNDVFTIKIDRFDSIPIKKNEVALIKLILTELVTKLSIFLQKNKGKLKSLNATDKEKFAIFIRLFFNTISNEEYHRIYDNIHKIKTKNLLIKLFNQFGIGIVNSTALAAVEISSTTIRQSFGFPLNESSQSEISFIKELTLISNDKISINEPEYTKEKLKQILDEVLLLIGKIGFNCTTVLFDKIDEYQTLGQDIVKISNFTSEILSDTELLLNEKLAIGFSLWSELKNELTGIVRFDKFGTIDVRWHPNDLIPLIDKRLKYFSKAEVVTLEKLIPNEIDRNDLIKVSNRSPRDLISALAEIYQVQANRNAQSNYFESKCITDGLTQFCSCYDYDSMTPSKLGKNQEIKSMINRILRVKLIYFTAVQLTNTFNQSSQQSEGQIRTMLKYKLIRLEDILGDNNEKSYEVIDPKVVFLIKRSIPEIE